jgi:hypothetical protein
VNLDHTLYLAKRGKLSRSDVYAAILKGAEERREPGQSIAQAFAKFATGEGAELMQLHSQLGAAGSGDVVHDYAPPPSAPIAKSAGSGEWHDMVAFYKRVHKREHPNDSDAKAGAAAVNATMSTEEGQRLFAQQKRIEQVATGQYTVADMALLDGIGAEQQAEVNKRANQYKSEFEHMVDDVRRERPHLTEMQAQDHVRSTEDGMAAWLRHKGKPGQNWPGHSADDGSRTPYVSTTSGRTDPPRISQWDSPHSGSRYTPPSGVPWDASNAPAVKQFGIMTRNVMKATRLPFGSAVGVVRASPEGEHVYQKMLAEMRASA